MRQRERIASGIGQRAATECQAVSADADAVRVGLVGQDGVVELQRGAARARGVTGQYRCTADMERQGGRAADADGLAQRDAGAEHVARVERVVLTAARTTEGHARDGRRNAVKRKTGRAGGADVARRIGGRGADAHAALAQCRQIGCAQHHRLCRTGTTGGQALAQAVVVGAERHQQLGARFSGHGNGAGTAAGNGGTLTGRHCQQYRCAWRLRIEHKAGAAGWADIAGHIGDSRVDADRALAQGRQIGLTQQYRCCGGAAGNQLGHAMPIAGVEHDTDTVARLGQNTDSAGTGQAGAFDGSSWSHYRRQRRQGVEHKAGAAARADVAGQIGRNRAHRYRALAQREKVKRAELHGLRAATAGETLVHCLAIGTEAQQHTGARLRQQRDGTRAACRLDCAFGGRSGHQHRCGWQCVIEYETGAGRCAVQPGRARCGAHGDRALAQQRQIGRAERDQGLAASAADALAQALAVGAEAEVDRGAQIRTDGNSAAAGLGAVFISTGWREQRHRHAVIQSEAGAAGRADVAGHIGGRSADGNA